ncbi:MAG: lipocalin-like domain-containing protein [Acidobacteriota bacterium]|nr:lipocalin-like domain-containing protein [Acidobacteriota bacterium]
MRYAIGLIGAVLVVGATALPVAQTAPSLQGAWRVTEVVVTGANAATNTSPQPGLYVFTGQHYSIITVNTARKDLGNPSDAAKLTDAEKMARYEAWNAFTANSGTYQISGSTLTTRPMVAKNPGVMGTSATREFKIDGKTLTLIQKSAAGQPASQTTTKLTRLE